MSASSVTITSFNQTGTSATVPINAPNHQALEHIVLQINYPTAPVTPRPTPSPSLCSRMVRGLFTHSGKIALVASALILASQTEVGAKILADCSKQATDFVVQNYEPAKIAIGQAVTEAVKFGKDNLAEINAGLSAVWAIPKVLSAGSKKMKAFWLLAGIASAAALKPAFIWEKGTALGNRDL
jgi:hypothetical protein